MIEIYRQVYTGKQHLVAQFDTYEEFFRRVWESDLKEFGYTKDERVNGRYLFGDAPKYALWMEVRFRYTAQEDGKFITPDRLIGMYRAYIANRKLERQRWWGNSAAYGGHRSVRTTQERKQAQYQDEEYYVPVRAARNLANLPEAWDDIISHNDRSWKTQSKRKRQYK